MLIYIADLFSKFVFHYWVSVDENFLIDVHKISVFGSVFANVEEMGNIHQTNL